MSPTRSQHIVLPIPNGWFAVAWSKDIDGGEVKRIRYFDEELVLFRRRSGKAKVLNAYCPHLGAHLGEGGRVMDDTVRCPFHGWQFNGRGRCTHIPYSDRIPAEAKVRAWDVVERNHMIFVWHHAEAKPPSWDVPIISQLDDPEWSEPRRFELEVPVHMQDMAENNLDPVHFKYIHKMPSVPQTEISFADGGRFLRAVSRTKQETPLGTFELDPSAKPGGSAHRAWRPRGSPTPDSSCSRRPRPSTPITPSRAGYSRARRTWWTSRARSGLRTSRRESWTICRSGRTRST